MKERIAIVGLLVLLAAGAFLRMRHLGDYTLNPDELIFASTANAATFGDVWRGSLANVHPPANFFVLHLMLWISPEALWLRSVSVFSGAAAIVLLYLFVRELFGYVAGLASAFLLAFSPNLIELSRVCRNYSPGIALLLAGQYVLVRHLRSGLRRDLYLYGVFSFLASAWHYQFAGVFIASGLTLAISLAVRRTRPADWLHAAAAQLPLALLMIFFYRHHISVMNRGMTDWVQSTMGGHFAVEPRAFMMPLIDLCRYLYGEQAGKPFFYAALAGIMLLAASRRWRELLVTLGPIVVAYAFLMAGLAPIGGTRHGVHLYPFLFALIGVSATELWRAFPALRRHPENPRSRMLIIFGMACVIAVGCGYGFLSLRSIFGATIYTNQAELPTRNIELDRTWEVLEKNIEDGDLVMVSYQGLMTLRYHFARELPPYAPESPGSFHFKWAHFHYSPLAGWILDHESFVRAAVETQERLALAAPNTVWAVRVASPPWEYSLSEDFAKAAPEIVVDPLILEQSEDRLFPLGAASYQKLRERYAAPPTEEFYRRDFLRSQFAPPSKP